MDFSLYNSQINSIKWMKMAKNVSFKLRFLFWLRILCFMTEISGNFALKDT